MPMLVMARVDRRDITRAGDAPQIDPRNARHRRDLVAYRRVTALGWTVARAARAARISERQLYRRLRALAEYLGEG